MKKKKSKGWIWIIVVVVLLLLLGLVLTILARAGKAGANAQQYEAVAVTRGDITVTVHGTGSLEAMDAATVSSAATGKVVSVPVENGDSVKKGDIIAQLDTKAENDQIQSLKDQITAQDATIATLRARPVMKTLYAPVDCRVKAIYTKTDEDVNVAMSANNALMLLSTDGKMKVDFVPAKGAQLLAGSAVKVIAGSKTVNGFVYTLPDGTTDKAEVVISNDTFAPGADATIADANGNALGTGKLEINRPLFVTADTGKIDYIYVKYNQQVDAGHKLLKLDGTILDPNFDSQLVKRQSLKDDLTKAYQDLADLTITAPADGVMTGLSVKEGGMAQEGMQVCTINENTGIKLVLAVDELDIPGVQLGQQAAVKIDALPGAAATANVVKIDPVGNKSNDVTTYDVTLQVNAPQGALTGMSASADILTASKTNALLVPVEALHTVDGKTWVYKALATDMEPAATAAATASGNAVQARIGGFFGKRNANASQQQREMVEVKVGLVSDSSAEILSGLNEGDRVAIPVTQSDTSSMMGFGGGNRNSSQGSPSATKSSGN